jgi:hypothetical protein
VLEVLKSSYINANTDIDILRKTTDNMMKILSAEDKPQTSVFHLNQG